MPPPGVEEIAPFEPELQFTLLVTVALTVSVGGSVIVAEAVAVHPVLSVTVRV